MKLVFLGPPGAGKGTIAALASKKFGVAHISTGDMLRNEIAQGTPLGLQAKRYTDSGALVPDDVIIDMVKNRLDAPDCVRGFILDGFPRTPEQAKSLGAAVSVDAVIYFDADPERVVKRVCGRRVCPACGEVYHVDWLEDGQNTCRKCGDGLIIRKDDNEETMRARLRAYDKQTAPLIAYYREKGVLQTIDANQDVDACFEDVSGIIGKASTT